MKKLMVRKKSTNQIFIEDKNCISCKYFDIIPFDNSNRIICFKYLKFDTNGKSNNKERIIDNPFDEKDCCIINNHLELIKEIEEEDLL